MPASPLSTKSCLIVGASGGIGAACAKSLAIAGASLLLSGRDLKKLLDLQSMLIAGGIEPERIGVEAGDLVVPDTAARLVGATTERYDRLDVVVNAAGLGYFESFGGAHVDRALLQLQVNTFGAIRLAHAALGALREARGHYVQIASGLAHTARARTAGYSASQHALVGFLDALRLEVGPKVRLSVLTVAGAGVDTPFWEGADRRVDRGAMMRPEAVAETLRSLLETDRSVVLDDIRIRTP